MRRLRLERNWCTTEASILIEDSDRRTFGFPGTSDAYQATKLAHKQDKQSDLKPVSARLLSGFVAVVVLFTRGSSMYFEVLLAAMTLSCLALTWHFRQLHARNIVILSQHAV